VFWIGEGKITFMANFGFKIIYNREQREFDHLYELGKARFANYLNFSSFGPVPEITIFVFAASSKYICVRGKRP
jgi:hypothetical protein